MENIKNLQQSMQIPREEMLRALGLPQDTVIALDALWAQFAQSAMSGLPVLTDETGPIVVKNIKTPGVYILQGVLADGPPEAAMSVVGAGAATPTLVLTVSHGEYAQAQDGGHAEACSQSIDFAVRTGYEASDVAVRRMSRVVMNAVFDGESHEYITDWEAPGGIAPQVIRELPEAPVIGGFHWLTEPVSKQQEPQPVELDGTARTVWVLQNPGEAAGPLAELEAPINGGRIQINANMVSDVAAMGLFTLISGGDVSDYFVAVETENGSVGYIYTHGEVVVQTNTSKPRNVTMNRQWHRLNAETLEIEPSDDICNIAISLPEGFNIDASPLFGDRPALLELNPGPVSWDGVMWYNLSGGSVDEARLENVVNELPRNPVERFRYDFLNDFKVLSPETHTQYQAAPKLNPPRPDGRIAIDESGSLFRGYLARIGSDDAATLFANLSSGSASFSVTEGHDARISMILLDEKAIVYAHGDAVVNDTELRAGTWYQLNLATGEFTEDQNGELIAAFAGRWEFGENEIRRRVARVLFDVKLPAGAYYFNSRWVSLSGGDSGLAARVTALEQALEALEAAAGLNVNGA